MENVLDVAAYVCDRYQKTYGEMIDEMKLHKLMYFAQRESLIQTDDALFDAVFHGWKYGPVLKELRKPYQDPTLLPPVPEDMIPRIQSVMDKVFNEYADNSSLSLSRLTHGEISWKRSRKGVSPHDNSDVAIDLEDIRLDAARISKRRRMLELHNAR